VEHLNAARAARKGYAMADLSTKYMGIELANPFLVASCSHTKTVEGVKKCAEGGAGAVVLKSLFEEQILADMHESEIRTEFLWHPEALDYVQRMGLELGPTEYLRLVRESKKAVSIPVIASLHCVTPKLWIDYVKKIADAGADAIELNISIMPSDPRRTAADIEKRHLDIVDGVTRAVTLPVAAKIGPYFTSIANIANELQMRGAAALVLFNRFYQFDVDLEKLELKGAYRLSTPFEIALPLRWIALLAGKVKCDLSASTGVHDAAGAAKMLLAGATTVQLCSALYLKGLGQIGAVRDGVESWMNERGMKTLADVRGRMSQMQSGSPELYERLQYIKALVGID
jgi:dihydroorotate dehydrogenase (fumarate)